MHSAGLERTAAVGVLGVAVVAAAAVGGCARDPSPPAPQSVGRSTAASAPVNGTVKGTGEGTGDGAVTGPGGSASRSASGARPTTPADPPVVPDAARAHTEAGAEAFVRFYIDQLNLAWTTPAMNLVSALSEPDCVSCATLEATTEQLVAKGQRYVSAPVSVRSAAAFGGAPSGQQLVHLVLQQHKVDVINAAGAIVTTDPPRDLNRNVVLKWRAEAWHVYAIAQ